MRVALYCRVSTSDQSCDLQLRELREYAGRCGWTIVDEFIDNAQSGAKAHRPQLDRLMSDARLRRFEVVACWRLDRWGRSLSNCLTSIEELDRLGVRFVVPGQGIDTDRNSPIGKLLMHVLGAVSQFERELIRERVIAGILTAQGKGKHCGRPKKVFRRDEALDMRQRGMSWREIGRRLGVAATTIREACAAPET